VIATDEYGAATAGPVWAFTTTTTIITGWQEVGIGSATGGGISDNDGDSRYPAIATASDGTPTIAWQDTSDGDSEIYVQRWNGSSWEEVGTGSASDGGISDNASKSKDPAIAVAPDGMPSSISKARTAVDFRALLALFLNHDGHRPGMPANPGCEPSGHIVNQRRRVVQREQVAVAAWGFRHGEEYPAGEPLRPFDPSAPLRPGRLRAGSLYSPNSVSWNRRRAGGYSSSAGSTACRAISTSASLLANWRSKTSSRSSVCWARR